MRIMAWIGLAVVCLAGVNRILYYTKYVKRINSIFKDGNDVILKDIIYYSNYELAKYIKKSFDKYNESITLYYLKRKSILLQSYYTRKQIMDEFDKIQNKIISDSIVCSLNLAIDDGIDQKILDIWIDYAHCKRFRKIFKEQLYELLQNGEISLFEYNIAYNRFYKFKRF